LKVRAFAEVQRARMLRSAGERACSMTRAGARVLGSEAAQVMGSEVAKGFGSHVVLIRRVHLLGVEGGDGGHHIKLRVPQRLRRARI